MVALKRSAVSGQRSAKKTAYLGLGSNIGNKRENIKKAISLLRQDVKVARVSSSYKTKPVGYTDQPDFINAVAEIKTNLTPRQLFQMVKGIEREMGRKKTFRNSPRVIDIDILLYNDKIIKTKELVIPHSAMHRRWFVLNPLAEIAPQVIHPKLMRTIKDLLARLKD